MTSKPWQVMTEQDYDRYKTNKKLYETKGDSDGRLQDENTRLREKYGITSDDYSYDDLQYQSAFGGNVYDKQADRSLNNAKKFRMYADPYANELYNVYNELKNFRYNPETDPTYKAYADMYARQGAAAQDKTYSDLTALSGGRNNSWASAATAQVGQAYAQKTADMIPQLAQQAYNKLLQQYNIASKQSDRGIAANQAAFDNAMKEYNAQKERADAYRKSGQAELDYERQLKNDEVANRQKEEQIKVTQLNAEKAMQEIAKNNIELQFLTEHERLKLMQGELDLEATRALIAQRKAAAAKSYASIK